MHVKLLDVYSAGSSRESRSSVLLFTMCPKYGVQTGTQSLVAAVAPDGHVVAPYQAWGPRSQFFEPSQPLSLPKEETDENPPP